MLVVNQNLKGKRRNSNPWNSSILLTVYLYCSNKYHSLLIGTRWLKPKTQFSDILCHVEIKQHETLFILHVLTIPPPRTTIMKNAEVPFVWDRKCFVSFTFTSQ